MKRMTTPKERRKKERNKYEISSVFWKLSREKINFRYMITNQLLKTATVGILLIITLTGCSTTRTWDMDFEKAKARVQQKLKEDDSSPEHRLIPNKYNYHGDLNVIRNEKEHYMVEIKGTRGNSFFTRWLTTQVSLKPLSPTSTKVSCKTSIHNGILLASRDSENEKLLLDALEKD